MKNRVCEACGTGGIKGDRCPSCGSKKVVSADKPGVVPEGTNVVGDPELAEEAS